MAEVTKEMIYETLLAVRADLDGVAANMHEVLLEAVALRIELENFPRLNQSIPRTDISDEPC